MRSITIVVLLFISMPVWSKQCDLSFTVQNATILVTDTPQVVAQPIQIKIDSKNNDCTYYRVFFGKGLAQDYQRRASANTSSAGVRTINYNLHRLINKVGILKDYGDALSANEYLDGTYTTNTTDNKSFHVSIDSLQTLGYPHAGTYIDSVQISVYSRKDSNQRYELEETKPFTLMFVVNKKVDISLVDEGSAFDSSSTAKTLDFGLIEKDQIKGADLRVVSNTPYQVKVSSLNNSSLKIPTNSIAYSFKVNGSTIALDSSASSPVTIGNGSTQTSQSGDIYNLKFQILSNTTDAAPGVYQDVITITAIAN